MPDVDRNGAHGSLQAEVRAGRRRVVARLGGGAVAVLALGYLWAIHDVAPETESATAILRAHAAMPPRVGAFGKLQALGERIRSMTSDASRRLPSRYVENARAADEILDSEVVQSLPSAIAELLSAPPLPGPEGAATKGADFVNGTWSTAHACVRVLSLWMERQLARGEQDAAWQTVELQRRFADFVRDQARSLEQLTLAEAAQATFLRALLHASLSNKLSVSQLRALASWREPTGLASQLLGALRGEYERFAADLERLRTEKGGPLAAVYYHPNRTRRAWLDAMENAAEALARGDIPDAYDQWAAERSTLTNERQLFRNALGQRLVVASIQGDGNPLAQTADLIAQARLLSLGAALALYRRNEGHLPATLDDLLERYLPALPGDPWDRAGTPFRYSAKDRRIYSVGRDRRDDHGLFDRELSYGDGSTDLGIRLQD